MRSLSLSWIVLAVISAVPFGCKNEASSAGQPTGSAAGSAIGAVAAPTPSGPPGTVKVFVNESPVATIDPAKLATWPRLDTLVPPQFARIGTWHQIRIKSGKPAMSDVDKPAEAYREYVPALFPGPGGAPSFGMFDPVELGKRGQPALREDGVVELHVKLAQGGGRGENDHQGGEVTDPSQLKLTIKSANGDQILTGDKLLAIPRTQMPGGGGDAKGWQLGTVLEAVGIKKFDKAVLTDAAGVSLTVESKELGPTTVPFIKLNRQGSLRFRIYKQQGANWQPAGDLRALATIQIMK